MQSNAKKTTSASPKKSSSAAAKKTTSAAAKKTTSAAAKKTSSQKNTKSSKSSNEEVAHGLNELFEDMLKDIYWAEKALTKALPKMIKKATSEDLSEALKSHLEETQDHVQRCEEVFQKLGKPAKAKKCVAMDGLIKEAQEIMETTEQGVVRDAGIIAAGQKVEHYEIASYGTMCAFAKILGLEEIAGILEETLNEEKVADEKLTQVAETSINMEAAEEGEEEG